MNIYLVLDSPLSAVLLYAFQTPFSANQFFAVFLSCQDFRLLKEFPSGSFHPIAKNQQLSSPWSFVGAMRL